MNNIQTLRAQADSKNGRVLVTIGSSAVAIPTTFDVERGDMVRIQIVNHKPCVIGVVGRGDQNKDKYKRLKDALIKKGIFSKEEIKEIEKGGENDR